MNARKQAINNKLLGNVATYLRYGGDVNNQSKKSLLLSLSTKKIKSVNIRQSYKQEGGCLVHFGRLATILLKNQQSAY